VVGLPKTFTLGEAYFVSLANALAALNILWIIFSAIARYCGIMVTLNLSTEVIVLLGVSIGMECVAILERNLTRVLRKAMMRMFFHNSQEGKKGPILLDATAFPISVGVLVVFLVYPWVVPAIGEDPFVWVLRNISSNSTRLYIILFWLIFLALAVGFVHPAWFGKSRIIQRKYFHAMAVIMFVPALVFDVKFLSLSFGVAYAAFLLGIETPFQLLSLCL
tara:strand:+ start:141 stop:800 length:660 start_codon:yes stop_codon:yes gene_type:complete